MNPIRIFYMKESDSIFIVFDVSSRESLCASNAVNPLSAWECKNFTCSTITMHYTHSSIAGETTIGVHIHSRIFRKILFTP